MRVLVVEDHRRLAAAVAGGLQEEGMAVDVAYDGQDALDHVARSQACFRTGLARLGLFVFAPGNAFPAC
jgi:DNA-binding response OmpR family regulator